MDAFQSPIEAFAFALNFNYVSFDILATTLQSLFTCFAILTAAISFWKFTTVGSNSFRRTKSSSSLSGDHLLDCSHSITTPPPTLPDQKPESELEKKKKKKPSNDEEEAATASSGCDFVGRRSDSSFVGPISIEDDGDEAENDEKRVNLKAKFTLYYSADEEEHIDGVCSSSKLVNYDGRWWCCEGFAARRVSDLASWYGYQDLTLLNGNVVRLWDCQRRRNSSFFPALAMEMEVMHGLSGSLVW